MEYPRLDREAARLDALRLYQILDTDPETAFDDLTRLAAQICESPVAFITLVDSNRQWFKSKVGVDIAENPLNVGFCPVVVAKGNILIVPDTLADEHSATNPIVVSKPSVRFYAGVPLTTAEGYILGTLCVVDYVPRELSQKQVDALQTLSRQVMTQLDLRLAARKVVKLDTTLIEVTQGVSASTGEAFFYSLAQHLSKALDVDYAYIGVVADDEENVRTLALCIQGQLVDNVEYSLRDTPCRNVIKQKKICCYSRGVRQQFPQAYLLEEMGVESYSAVPFFDSKGCPLGLIGVMDRKPLSNIQLAESLLTIFATRVSTELERQQTEIENTRLYEAEQQARTQAEAANRIKDEFLAVLSHELRSPLNPILGWSRLLRSRKFDEAKTAYALETIERNAKLQSQLVEDLLDVSRILQGKLSLNVCPVNLATIIEGAIETVRLAAEAKSIHIQTIFAPNVEQVLGDANRLQQVVWNLVSNAVKFTPSGGQVCVRLDCQGNQAKIQVSDTGKGINPDFLPYVFDYFRQADSTTTRVFGGLGLGLAIVRHLIELHGGTVFAESPGVGFGATFTLVLPVKSVVHQAGENKGLSNDEPNLEGVRVLVVDDEVDTRELIVFILQEYGASVRAVASASEALEVLPIFKPEILLSDIGMPSMDGYMLIRTIRAMPEEQGGQIPAIALTAYASEVDHQQALTAGFQRHLPKPVDPSHLASTIANLVRTKQKDFSSGIIGRS